MRIRGIKGKRRKEKGTFGHLRNPEEKGRKKENQRKGRKKRDPS